MLWQSDGNFIKIVFGRDANSGDRRFEIASDDPTDTRNLNSPNQVVDGSFPETAWIRASREGNIIMAEFAPDEGGAPGEWQPFGGTRPVSGVDPLSGIEIDPPREGEGVQLGLYAGSDVDGAPFEQEAAFDFARLEPDEPCPGNDTTPPETDAQLNGDDPVASYDGPVDVTLSATDPGGGGEPQTHEVDSVGALWEPDEIEVSVGDDVQWNFDAGQTSFPHDVWLVPPGGDPDPDGEDIFEVTDGPVSAGGDPVSYTFDQSGAWQYICKVHSGFSGGEWSGMTGTAEVAEGGGEPSGVDFTEYRIDSDDPGDWVQSDNTAGDDPFLTEFTVSGEGPHEVEYRSVDNAENEETVNSVEFEITGGPGEAALDLSVKPRRQSVKVGKLATFTATATNRGDAEASDVKVCVKAPKKKVKVVGKTCAAPASLAADDSIAPKFKLKPKRKAAGKKLTIAFTAKSPDAENVKTTATLKVKRR
jgi:plastocyanin